MYVVSGFYDIYVYDNEVCIRSKTCGLAPKSQVLYLHSRKKYRKVKILNVSIPYLNVVIKLIKILSINFIKISFSMKHFPC